MVDLENYHGIQLDNSGQGMDRVTDCTLRAKRRFGNQQQTKQ